MIPTDSQMQNAEFNYLNSFTDDEPNWASTIAKWDVLIDWVKKDPPTGSMYKKMRNKGLEIK